MTGRPRHEPRRSALAGSHPVGPTGVGAASSPPPPASAGTAPKPSTEPLPAADAPRSRKMTVNVREDLQEQAKDAYWLVRDEHRTFSDWVASAITAKIEETKRAAGVDDLPARPRGGLPTGRPLS